MSDHTIDSRQTLITKEQIEKLDGYFAHKPPSLPTYRTIGTGVIRSGSTFLYITLTSITVMHIFIQAVAGAQDNGAIGPEGLVLLPALFIPVVFTLPFLDTNKGQPSNMANAILPATSPFYVSTLEDVERQQYTIKQLKKLGNPADFPQLEKAIAAAEEKIKKAQETFDQSLKPTAAQQNAIELAIEDLRP